MCFLIHTLVEQGKGMGKGGGAVGVCVKKFKEMFVQWSALDGLLCQASCVARKYLQQHQATF